MPTENTKPNSPENDPEILMRLLDIELQSKRSQWKRVAAQRNTFRAVALFFLIAVIAGALATYFFIANSSSRPRTQPRNVASPLSSP